MKMLIGDIVTAGNRGGTWVVAVYCGCSRPVLAHKAESPQCSIPSAY
jgi:hypothetical protein